MDFRSSRITDISQSIYVALLSLVYDDVTMCHNESSQHPPNFCLNMLTSIDVLIVERRRQAGASKRASRRETESNPTSAVRCHRCSLFATTQRTLIFSFLYSISIPPPYIPSPIIEQASTVLNANIFRYVAPFPEAVRERDAPHHSTHAQHGRRKEGRRPRTREGGVLGSCALFAVLLRARRTAFPRSRRESVTLSVSLVKRERRRQRQKRQTEAIATPRRQDEQA